MESGLEPREIRELRRDEDERTRRVSEEMREGPGTGGKGDKGGPDGGGLLGIYEGGTGKASSRTGTGVCRAIVDNERLRREYRKHRSISLVSSLFPFQLLNYTAVNFVFHIPAGTA